MQNQSKPAISDAQLGRVLRRYLADYRDCAIRKLPGERDEPYVLVALARDGEEGGRTADEVQLSAPTLEALIDALLGEATDLGRDLAISELFEDEAAGFDLNGLSMGTLATATHLAPGVALPRVLLYAVNATIQPLALYNDAAETDETAQATNTGASLALRLFTYPALRLAEATIEHLCESGALLQQTDDSLLLAESLRPIEEHLVAGMGLALAQRALLGLVPPLFAGNHSEELRHIQPHLRYVTDQVLPLATPNAMALAFLTADYYTTIEPDLDLLRYYTIQGCAILDLVIEELEPAVVPYLAHDLYGLAKVAQDAGMHDVAQIAYVRSFEVSVQVGTLP
jgi:hypothetical protein